MAKRFTDTNKYKKPFIRGLQGAYKLLWDYLYHDCDHAGIWIVDFDIAQIYIGSDMPINKSDALKYFNTDEIRIVELNGGSKWFIPSFVEFQYGELSLENRAHKSVITILNKYNLITNKGLIRGLQAHKDKDKELDKDKEKESFNTFWDEYHKITKLTKTDKESALKYWKKLNNREREKAVDNIQPYFSSLKDKKYCKKARTYLSDKNFNDEFKKKHVIPFDPYRVEAKDRFKYV